MKTLDLHGIKHQDVEKIVANFLYLNEPPVRIITGNSHVMQTLVKSVVAHLDYKCEIENYWNLGSLIITN